MSTQIATQPTETSLVKRISSKFGVDADKMLATLKATCFHTKQAASNEQMMALLVVAEQYNLNPWTKEIFAFEDSRKGIVPVVSVDGWARIINENKAMDGIEFRYSETMVTMPGGKPCPEWCEAVIYRKDRNRPTVIREYLDEVYQPARGGFSGPWQSHSKRFLRHKTLIQCARVAFGFAGIYDEDEAQRILQAKVVSANSDVTGIEDDLRKIAAERAVDEPIDVEHTEVEEFVDTEIVPDPIEPEAPMSAAERLLATGV